MRTIWLRALHFPPPCTSIDEEFHLQRGFTLIREGAVIQASIHFSGTLQSLKVLTHWVKLSREDKKGASSREVTAARFSTPCTLLEKCHKLSMGRKMAWLPSSLNDAPYKMKDLRVEKNHRVAVRKRKIRGDLEQWAQRDGAWKTANAASTSQKAVLMGMAIFARRDRRGLSGSTKSDTAVPELEGGKKKGVVLIHKAVNWEKTYCISALLRTICFQAATRWLNTTTCPFLLFFVLYFNGRSSSLCSLFLLVLMLLLGWTDPVVFGHCDITFFFPAPVHWWMRKERSSALM